MFSRSADAPDIDSCKRSIIFGYNPYSVYSTWQKWCYFFHCASVKNPASIEFDPHYYY